MGPSASSHGSPVPLPSDLSFRSPTPSNLPMVQLWAAHAHEGFSHLPSGLYPSYLHLNHLEPPSSGSPLLSQLGQPSIFDTQKGQGPGGGKTGVRGWGWHRGLLRGFWGLWQHPGSPQLCPGCWLFFFFFF
ncbi:hCG96198, isoform CRA_d [Homo sapiens]|uniref:HCG96198, isoform CRA_d n=1 Tax=Homo sapiens TaxID=9606 RepID=A8MTZ4_HUMAN|nr:hCG96198, isoform CRA_d [Homo sapiens]KAI2544868.1 trinucleotide repeat containing 18 [Homo sapiens]